MSHLPIPSIASPAALGESKQKLEDCNSGEDKNKGNRVDHGYADRAGDGGGGGCDAEARGTKSATCMTRATWQK